MVKVAEEASKELGGEARRGGDVLIDVSRLPQQTLAYSRLSRLVSSWRRRLRLGGVYMKAHGDEGGGPGLLQAIFHDHTDGDLPRAGWAKVRQVAA